MGPSESLTIGLTLGWVEVGLGSIDDGNRLVNVGSIMHPNPNPKQVYGPVPGLVLTQLRISGPKHILKLKSNDPNPDQDTGKVIGPRRKARPSDLYTF